MDNKTIFARNLQKYMDLNGKTRRDVCDALGFSYYTFTDWVKGKKYPRMDKVEMLANYFGIQKSDLIEEKEISEKKEKTDVAVDIVFRLGADQKFCEAVKLLYQLDEEKLDGVSAMLRSLVK